MTALHALVTSGKVRYLGASSMWTWQFSQMQHCAERLGLTKFISMQNHYSLLYREEEREMIPYCLATGIGLIPWGPLAAGLLARPANASTSTQRGQNKADDPLRNEDILNKVEEIAQKKGWTMTQVALAWIRKRCTSPIVGFSSVERIDEALARQDEGLTEDEERELESRYKILSVMGHS